MTDSHTVDLTSAEDLARQARDGSSAAFADLVARYVERLFRYLRHKAPTNHDAEDLVQETFLRAFSSIRSYQPGRRFSTWLFTIATRLAISRHRARRPQVNIEGMDLPDAKVGSPHDAAAQREQHDSLWALAAEVLPESHFAALWLRYAEDMPMKEIAAVLSKTRIHVKVMLHRARQRLLLSQPAGWQATGTPPARPVQRFPVPSRGEASCGAE